MVLVVPYNPLIDRTVAEVDYRSRDIGEAGQEVRVDLFPVVVILDDSPEEQVAVYLKGRTASPDRVIVDPLPITGAKKIIVGETQ